MKWIKLSEQAPELNQVIMAWGPLNGRKYCKYVSTNYIDGRREVFERMYDRPGHSMDRAPVISYPDITHWHSLLEESPED